MATPEIQQITDHNDQAKARLIQFFLGATNFDKLIDIRVNQHQELETAIYDLIAGRQLDTAIGVQLDLIGALVGVSRPGGLSDDDYRALIIAQIQINVSSGTAPDVIQLLQLLQADDILFIDTYPAGIQIQYVTGSTILDNAGVKDAVIKATAPIEIELSSFDAVEPFGFLGDPDAFGFTEGFLGEH